MGDYRPKTHCVNPRAAASQADGAVRGLAPYLQRRASLVIVAPHHRLRVRGRREMLPSWLSLITSSLTSWISQAKMVSLLAKALGGKDETRRCRCSFIIADASGMPIIAHDRDRASGGRRDTPSDPRSHKSAGIGSQRLSFPERKASLRTREMAGVRSC